MSQRGFQPSFSSGVLAPSLFSRIDLARFPLGAKTISNAFVQKQGGVCNRTGFEYVGNTKAQDEAARLIAFAYNTTQTYALEFGDQYMRVIKDGGHVTETAVVITGATAADPVVVTTSGAHGYSNGDEVFLADVAGMTELNNRRFLIANKTATTFELQDLDAVDIDGSGYTAYTSGGTSAKIYELATPYVIADLRSLKVTQSADVMTITHPSYAVRELTRTAHNAWTLTAVSFGNGGIGYPTGIAKKTPYLSTTGYYYAYAVTAVDENGNESLTGTGNSYSISNVTRANPGVLTHNGTSEFQIGDEVLITGISGMTELNDLRFRVRSIPSSTTLTLEDLDGDAVDTSAYTTYSSGGTIYQCFELEQWNEDRGLYPSAITWSPVTGAKYYRVYFDPEPGIYADRPHQTLTFGFLGDSESTGFHDSNYQNDLTDRPPRAITIFAAADDYPSTVTYFEQRRVFANSNNAPQSFWFSQTARSSNFNKSQPLRDDDALEFTIRHNEVNAIKHMVSNQGKLILFTTGGEWLVNSGQAPISASNIPKMEPQSTNGSSDLAPLVVNDTILYVDASERMIRDLKYSFERDARAGSDLSVMAEHLFQNRSIVSWCYAKRPNNLIWMVMDDGDMVGLTYLPEHDIRAFHEHETTGNFKSVCSIREGNEDVVYAIVQRTINGATRYFVERLHERDFSAVEDAFFVDCGATYDGAPATTISGLWHLEGESVSGLADGEPFTGKTVTNGAITFASSKSVVHVGLSYTCDLETLPLGAVELQGREHKIQNAFLRVQDTRGLKAGWSGDATTLDDLSDPYEADATPQPLQTKIYKSPIQSDWRREAGILMRSTTALPWTVLGVGLDVSAGK